MKERNKLGKEGEGKEDELPPIEISGYTTALSYILIIVTYPVHKALNL